jgi:hypothetical protein
MYYSSAFSIDEYMPIKLEQALLRIKNGFNDVCSIQEKIRNNTNEEEQVKLKKKLPIFVFQGEFIKREIQGLKKSSGYIVFDIDYLEPSIIKDKIKNDPYIFSLWSSVRKGVKGLIKIPLVEDDLEYKKYFYSIEKYFKDNYDLKIDPSCKDISRATFLSYDPGLIINYESKIYNNKNTNQEIVEIKNNENIVKKTITGNIDKGERNSSLFKTASSFFGKGMDRESVLVFLKTANEKFSQPLNETEIELIVKSAEKYKINLEDKKEQKQNNNTLFTFNQVYRMVSNFKNDKINRENCIKQLNEYVLDTELSSNILNLLYGEEQPLEDIKGKIVSGDELITEIIPETEWTLDKFIVKGGLTYLAGAPKSFKSFLSTHIAIQVSLGNSVFNKKSVKSKVLIFDQENKKVLVQRRLNLLRKGDNFETLPNLFIWNGENLKLDDSDAFEPIKNIIQELKPELIIIDSLVRFMNGDPDKESDVRKVFENIKPFLEQGISFLILHHQNKASGNKNNGNTKLNSLRGSGDIGAQADIVFLINKLGNSYKVEQVANRHEESLEPFLFNVKPSNDGIKINYIGECVDEVSLQDQCYSLLKEWFRIEHITISASTREIETFLISETKVKKGSKTIDRVIKDLCESNVIKKDSRGKYSLVSEYQDKIYEEELN